MTTLTFTPKEFDDQIDLVLLAFVEQVQKHMNCLCKKKIHKNCPKHNATVAMKMVFDQRAPLGDKLLYLQSRNTAPKQSIILP